ncbi:MAG: hypothetical protein ABI718_17080 [Acidobacteriota bacterium]
MEIARLSLNFSATPPPTITLGREMSKPLSVGDDGTKLRRLAEQVLTQYVELNTLRAAIAASAADFEYRQPQPFESTVVNVVFMPGVLAAPPKYDFD